MARPRLPDETRIAEAYLHGDIDFDGDMLAALDLRRFLSDRHPLASLWRFVQPWLYGEVGADKTWVPQHYDYGNEFYFSFLDRKFRLYSQAVYTVDDETLEQAAQNKLDYVMDIGRLGPGGRVLDVGGGWGSFAGYAASRGTDVTMLTISREQFAYLSEWCATHTLPARLSVAYESIFAYAPDERYDAIVLCGVMEHLPDYPPSSKFDASRAGRTRVHGLRGGEEEIRRERLHLPLRLRRPPGGAPRALRRRQPDRLEPVALHNDRHSYCLTHGRGRATSRPEAGARGRYGERVCRLFQSYLWAGAHLHRDGGLEAYRAVFQKGKNLPSAEIGLGRESSVPR